MDTDLSNYWDRALQHEGLLNQICGRYLQKLNPELGLSFEDLKSYGWEGLLHAARGFDPSRGTRWSTYAATCVRHALDRAVRDRVQGGRKGLSHLPTLLPLDEAPEIEAQDELPLHGSIPPAVLKAITELPLNEERVIYYSFIDGLSDELIGAMLYMTPGSVGRIRRRALDKLKEVLVDGSEDPKA